MCGCIAHVWVFLSILVGLIPFSVSISGETVDYRGECGDMADTGSCVGMCACASTESCYIQDERCVILGCQTADILCTIRRPIECTHVFQHPLSAMIVCSSLVLFIVVSCNDDCNMTSLCCRCVLSALAYGKIAPMVYANPNYEAPTTLTTLWAVGVCLAIIIICVSVVAIQLEIKTRRRNRIAAEEALSMTKALLSRRIEDLRRNPENRREFGVQSGGDHVLDTGRYRRVDSIDEEPDEAAKPKSIGDQDKYKSADSGDPIDENQKVPVRTYDAGDAHECHDSTATPDVFLAECPNKLNDASSGNINTEHRTKDNIKDTDITSTNNKDNVATNDSTNIENKIDDYTQTSSVKSDHTTNGKMNDYGHHEIERVDSYDVSMSDFQDTLQSWAYDVVMSEVLISNPSTTSDLTIHEHTSNIASQWSDSTMRENYHIVNAAVSDGMLSPYPSYVASRGSDRTFNRNQSNAKHEIPDNNQRSTQIEIHCKNQDDVNFEPSEGTGNENNVKVIVEIDEVCNDRPIGTVAVTHNTDQSSVTTEIYDENQGIHFEPSNGKHNENKNHVKGIIEVREFYENQHNEDIEISNVTNRVKAETNEFSKMSSNENVDAGSDISFSVSRDTNTVKPTVREVFVSECRTLDNFEQSDIEIYENQFNLTDDMVGFRRNDSRPNSSGSFHGPDISVEADEDTLKSLMYVTMKPEKQTRKNFQTSDVAIGTHQSDTLEDTFQVIQSSVTTLKDQNNTNNTITDILIAENQSNANNPHCLNSPMNPDVNKLESTDDIDSQNSSVFTNIKQGNDNPNRCDISPVNSDENNVNALPGVFNCEEQNGDDSQRSYVTVNADETNVKEGINNNKNNAEFAQPGVTENRYKRKTQVDVLCTTDTIRTNHVLSDIQ